MTRSRVTKLIFFFIALAFVAGVIFAFSSILGITELVYPVKIDSAYVTALQRSREREIIADTVNPALFLFKPEQLEMQYENMKVMTYDSLLLSGWYFMPVYEELGITILIIPDINESKISYLEGAKAFTERGFRVCCVDMRACGESEGSYFTMGTISAIDIRSILDSLYCRPETKHVAVMGTGTGAAIAIQAASYDQRPIALIAQNAFAGLTGYFSRYASHKWGVLGKWFFPLMKKELDRQTGFNSDSLNLQKLVLRISKPSLFIARAKESIEDLKETHLLYERSKALKKEFLFFGEMMEEDLSQTEQKDYYDKISAFISTAIPKKVKRTRFKKLVLDDHPVNH
jgi:pimeloyl-ACP methyl ester carboxylesterase